MDHRGRDSGTSGAELLLCLTLALALAAACGRGQAPDRTGHSLVFDFNKRIQAARTLVEQPSLDIGEAWAHAYLGPGWGSDERRSVDGVSYKWAMDRRAELELVVFDTALDRVFFRCWPFTWPGAPEQSVTVMVNRREVGSVKLEAGRHEYSLRVPRGVLISGVNRVAFEFAYAERVQARRPHSTDSRTLAAAFDAVGFGSGPELEPSPGPVDVRPPMVRNDELVFEPGAGAIFAVNHRSEVVLSFGLQLTGSPPGDAALLVWSRRAGGDPVELLRTGLVQRNHPRLDLAIEPGAGRLEVGFAVSRGTTRASDDWTVGLTSPRLTGLTGEGEDVSNVLLIVVDTLRADRVGVYGSSLSTPNMDGLAARGVMFRNAYSHIPITGPSHASLFTSTIPAEHGVYNNGQILSDAIPNLAETLRDDGRNTAGVISLGVLKRRFGHGRGFDVYHDEFRYDWMKNAAEVNHEVMDLLDGALPEPYFLWVHYSDPHEPYTPPGFDYPVVALELNGESRGELSADGRGVGLDLELAPGTNSLRFSRADPDRRRLFRMRSLRLEDPEIGVKHGNGWNTNRVRFGKEQLMTRFPATLDLENPTPGPRRVRLELAIKEVLSREDIRIGYDREVEYVDREIGSLLEFMGERGLLANTLVVLLSDHGESLGEHNHVGHISQLYDQLIRVPLIVAFPGRLPEGLVVDQPVGLKDVFPTMSGLLELEPPASVKGMDLAPLWSGQTLAHPGVTAETHRPEAYSDKRALIVDGFKYIHSWTDDREWEELYDLSADPNELRDLSAADPDRLATMREELRRRLREATPAEVIEAQLSEKEIERLRALGYLH